MKLSKNEIIKIFNQNIYDWSLSQREKHYESADFISKQDQIKFSRYFDVQLLKQTKIKFVDVVEPPILSSSISGNIDEQKYLDLYKVAGVAFGDCILIISKNINKELNFSSLLFHELIHCAQFKILGRKKYVEIYTREWINSGFKYQAISLESIAHKLTERYEQGLVFSVVDSMKDEVDLKKIWGK